jgi:cystathionine beta-synthase
MQVFSNVLEMVGRTPMLEVTNFDTGPCRLFLKLELANPAGSIKDRIGISMIEQAEKRGDIKPGDTIVEATAGNTGLGLALVAQQKGYSLILVLPDKMSQEKIFNLRAMGAEVVLTRSDVDKGHPEYYQDLGKAIAEEKGAYFINQFGNPDNPLAHEQTTAPEMFEQMDGDIDAIVLGAGSCGTASGFSKYLKNSSYDTELILADPVKELAKTSSLTSQILTGSRRPTALPMGSLLIRPATCCTRRASSWAHLRERSLLRHSSTAASRQKRSVWSVWPAIPVTSTCPSCSMISGWRIRALSRVNRTAICGTWSGGRMVNEQPLPSVRTMS